MFSFVSPTDFLLFFLHFIYLIFYYFILVFSSCLLIYLLFVCSFICFVQTYQNFLSFVNFLPSVFSFSKHFCRYYSPIFFLFSHFVCVNMSFFLSSFIISFSQVWHWLLSAIDISVHLLARVFPFFCTHLQYFQNVKRFSIYFAY